MLKPFAPPLVGAVIESEEIHTSLGKTGENSRRMRSQAMRWESAAETACNRGACSALTAGGVVSTAAAGAGGIGVAASCAFAASRSRCAEATFELELRWPAASAAI